MTTSPLRLAVNGAQGRMGSRIIALASEDARLQVTMPIDVGADHAALREAGRNAATRVHAIIDFSSDAGANQAMALAESHSAALLVGTTALSETTRARLRQAATTIPVMIAPNTSLGVAVVRHLAAEASRLLGADWNVDILEYHHTRKKDAPSGTAIAIADAVRGAGREVPDDRIHAIRAGDIIGEHTLQFAAAGELIQITHRATTRDLFASGALKAARWLAAQKPGMYTIADSLELSKPR
jgi:4-hydroxy-tetrahydrodipicolinate reductase